MAGGSRNDRSERAPRVRRQLTRPARNDIAAILDWSHDRFGATGRRRYERLIARALIAITRKIPPIGSRAADVASDGIRLFHLRNAKHDPDIEPAGRPRHFIVYRIFEPDLVVVLRVLHEAMNLPVYFMTVDRDD